MTKRRLNLRNVVKIGVACLAVTMMFLGCKDDNSDHPEIGMTYHDNDVLFWVYNDPNGNFTENSFPQWSITGGRFTMTAHDVTQGQDPDNKLWNGKAFTIHDDNQFTFTVGRKASKEVANSFNAICPPEHNTFGHTAGELNFWVKGTLVLHFGSGNVYTLPNTVLAQGHSGAANNWWFGNDAMSNSQEPILLYDPYSRFEYYIPIPVYGGSQCYGLVSPMEDPTLVFKFQRGDGIYPIPPPPNIIYLVGVYTRTAPAEPW